MLNVESLKAALPRWCAAMHAATAELNELDGRVGDGDLGNTLDRSAVLIGEALPGLPETLEGIFQACARASAQASGSSFGTLLAIALLTAQRQSADVAEMDRAQVAAMLSEIVKALSARGGAKLGDKTVLDGLHAIQVALESSDKPATGAKTVALVAIGEAMSQYKGLPNQIGRARMFAEKTIGLDDPGMVALQRMVEGL